MTKIISRRNFLQAALAASATVLAGCSASGSNGSESDAGSAPATTVAATTTTGKTLIVTFSWGGNTLAMADRLRELAPDADFFRIEAAEAYPEDYNETADLAKSQQDQGILPAYQGDVEDWASYDTVFLGYPIWWYGLPQIVKTFLGDHDWSGKTVVPFNSHEGSGDGGTPAEISELVPRIVLAENLAIRGNQVASSLGQVDEWYARVTS